MHPDELDMLRALILDNKDIIEEIRDSINIMASGLMDFEAPLVTMAEHFDKLWTWGRVGLAALLYTNVLHTGQAGIGALPMVRKVASMFLNLTGNGKDKAKRKK